jgi:16S rRNA G966 N2-methylase RsmD
MKFPLRICNESSIYGGVDYTKFSTNKDSIYSSVRPYHFSQIRKILRKICPNPRLVLDICSHIGASAVNISTIFPQTKTVCVEVKKSVYNLLQDNISAFRLKSRVIAIHANAVPFLKKTRYKADIVNIDPPWGGPSYSRRDKMMLNLYNTSKRCIPIYELVNIIFDRCISNIVVFKAPFNFDIHAFKKNVKGSMNVYNIYNETDKKNSKKIAYIYIVMRKTSLKI